MALKIARFGHFEIKHLRVLLSGVMGFLRGAVLGQFLSATFV